jgi:carboxyl-terminal processing protease
MNRPKFYVYLPIVFSLVLILGILIGHTFNKTDSSDLASSDGGIFHSGSKKAFSKLDKILRYINTEYVDTVNSDALVEKSIVALLRNLDPHSAYISAAELADNNEPLKGNFEGIGIEFNIVDDTIRVIAAIPNGPSEKVGVMAGDRIVEVNGKKVTGIKITNKMVLEKLKGAGGTKVKVGIKRSNSKDLIEFVITRGLIPIFSVDAAYMLTAKIGYIKISRFAATTYDEYLKAFGKLQQLGMQQLVIDLRGNGGGYLNSAVSLADEFLGKGKEIVYTQGKARVRQDYLATDIGGFENGKLVVLIDDGSASASEILAGALQDNDRATILGRRSFGKGLVQEQMEFDDGSALRLTIARYYTPTGRCIQKSYNKGVDAYFDEEYDRYTSGELESADSIKLADSIQYKTPGGKIVYGGGGIIPDVFVPLDTSGRTHYLSKLFYSGVMNDFAFAYADKEREKLNNYKTVINFEKQFSISDALIKEFIVYAEKNKINRNDKEEKLSEGIIKTQLKALIARNIWKNEGYFQILQVEDKVILKAIDLLR